MDIPKKDNFYIVGIGASGGGLEAIQQLFDHIPDHTGMSFVIIQHLSPDFISLMPELLSKHTQMEVLIAENNQEIKPNCIYLNLRKTNLQIVNRAFKITSKNEKRSLNLPIDIFLHSLGTEFKEKAIGIILSGTGTDGARGIKTIKENGGIVFAQQPSSAQFISMPNAAIATNAVDFVLPPSHIAKKLMKTPRKSLENELKAKDKNNIIFLKILELIKDNSAIDFGLYKKNTLIRRLENRLKISEIDSISNYFNLLKKDKNEVNNLTQDFLIGVTSFFRNPEAFNLLKNEIIPEIISSKGVAEHIRVWVPACSTGEEVYSIAILLEEYIQKNKVHIDYKIFGTDLDKRALKIASSGKYYINAIDEMNAEYVDTYFSKHIDSIQIIDKIRKKIVFTNHNILKDPPFIRMDLVSCRNMLIYFENKSQKDVLSNLEFALNTNGFLFLGKSESLGIVSKMFQPVDKQWKIFKKIHSSKKIPPNLNLENNFNISVPKISYKSILDKDFIVGENKEEPFKDFLINQNSPSSIFIDEDYNILYVKGDAGKRITIPERIFQNNLLKGVNTEIASIIQKGIQNLEKQKNDILIKSVVNRDSKDPFIFDLSFHKPPQAKGNKTIYLLQFIEQKVSDTNNVSIIKDIPLNEISKQRIENLENDLMLSQTKLRFILEELEASNEESQTSNEELMASNEELQSTNEELQSVNAELYTVNSEIQEKNKELTSINDDTGNLLNNTEIGTLFLDTHLKIRKFTPALQKHFNLKASDINRPIADFASNFDNETKDTIIEESKRSLEKLELIENEIIDKDGNYFFKRISPFITSDKKIDGVVLSLVNIDKLKKTQSELSKSNANYQQLFAHLNEGFAHAKIINDTNGKPIDCGYININPAFELLTDTKAVNLIEKGILKIFPGALEDPEKWLKIFSETAKTGKEQIIQDYSKSLEKHFNVHLFRPRKGEFAATYSDITQLKINKQALVKSEKELKKVQKVTQTGSWYYDIETKKINCSDEVYKMFEIATTLESQVIAELENLLIEKSTELLKKSILKTIETGTSFHIELEIHKKDKRTGWIWVTGERMQNEQGKTIGLWGAAQDISERKYLYEKLKYEQQFTKKITESSASGIYIFDFKKGINTFVNNQYTKILGYTLKEIKKITKENFNLLFHPEDLDRVLHHMKKVSLGGEHQKVSYRFKHKKGHWVWCYSVDSSFEKDNDDKVISFIGVFIDITKQKLVEEKLIEAKKIAESANIHKNYFLANMGHEIRTPMNGVIGFTQLLLEKENSPEKIRKYLKIIERNSQQLLTLIDEIIDIAKIESQELKISLESCHIKDLLDDLQINFNQIKENLDKKNIKLTLEIPSNFNNLVIQTDPNRLRQVLSNLLTNAFKFSEKGTIKFGFAVKKSFIEFYISDEGIGISKDKLTEIFERFKQLNYENAAKYGGTGLGLAISKGIVELLGGSIQVTSKLGIGSRFSFTIPKGQIGDKIVLLDEKKIPPDYSTFLEGKRILIAEDDDFVQFYLSEVLEPYNPKVIFANNGEEALKIYSENQNFDLILMDIRMPIMNGYRTTEAILKINPEAKIIAQTAHATHNELDKCIQSGCLTCINKPISKDLLLETLYAYI